MTGARVVPYRSVRLGVHVPRPCARVAWTVRVRSPPAAPFSTQTHAAKNPSLRAADPGSTKATVGVSHGHRFPCTFCQSDRRHVCQSTWQSPCPSSWPPRACCGRCGRRRDGRTATLRRKVSRPCSEPTSPDNAANRGGREWRPLSVRHVHVRSARLGARYFLLVEHSISRVGGLRPLGHKALADGYVKPVLFGFRPAREGSATGPASGPCSKKPAQRRWESACTLLGTLTSAGGSSPRGCILDFRLARRKGPAIQTFP